MCSTPFGIIGIRTANRFLAIASVSSAQRLSASSEFALHSATFTQTALPRCSTPFGIIGIRTLIEQQTKLSYQVLNAFRHHRNSHRACGFQSKQFRVCSTPFGIIGIRTGSG